MVVVVVRQQHRLHPLLGPRRIQRLRQQGRVPRAALARLVSHAVCGVRCIWSIEHKWTRPTTDTNPTTPVTRRTYIHQDAALPRAEQVCAGALQRMRAGIQPQDPHDPRGEPLDVGQAREHAVLVDAGRGAASGCVGISAATAAGRAAAAAGADAAAAAEEEAAAVEEEGEAAVDPALFE